MLGPVHVVTKPIVSPFPLYADFFNLVGDPTVVRWISKVWCPFQHINQLVYCVLFELILRISIDAYIRVSVCDVDGKSCDHVTNK